jgi:hypothetical protein
MRQRVCGRGVSLVELTVVGLLLAALLTQLLWYPPTDDPDPDGFVTYTQQMLATGSLPESRRLPGYPVFLALASKLSARPLANNVYWLQLALMLAFSAAAWAVVRRWGGPLTAALFLAILAAPSFFARMSVVMLPDFIYALLFLPVFLAMVWWVLALRQRGGWVWLALFAVGLFVLQALRPTTAPLTALLLPALGVGWLSQRWTGRSVARLRDVLARGVALTVVALVVFAAVDRLLDTGARAYNATVPMYRAVIFLPPASDSPAEARIEAAKARFAQSEGQPIERARFQTYPRFRFYDEMRLEDVAAVWRDRLLAHPGRYLLSVWDDLRLGHYLLARTMVPFVLDLDRVPLFQVLYPPDDGSPRSQVFRRTGLILLEREPYPAMFPVQVEVAQAILALVAVWGLSGLGVWQLGRIAPGLTATFAVLGLLLVLMTAATNTVDPRYLLPVMPLVYLAEATGLAWIVRRLLGQLRTGAASAQSMR